MMKKSTLFFFLLFTLTSFYAESKDFPTGYWRLELHLSKAKVPFLIKLDKHSKTYSGSIFNGKETISLDGIKQTLTGIVIPIQDYEITMELHWPKKGKLKGQLIRHNKNPILKFSISGEHGMRERFTEKLQPTTINLTGNWSVDLIDENGGIEKGILTFEQNKNKFNGSILTPTGDYRYMEGRVYGNEFIAASFDGVFNYLLKGKINGNRIEAYLLSNSKTKISGERNPNAKLPNAYQQTQIDKIQFSFPDLSGNNISLSHKRFLNRPVIIQLFGSWCPNCIDEMNYLIPWYNKNHSRNIEIIALAFERSLTLKDSKIQLLKIQKKKNLPYTLLLAGATSSDRPQDKLPGLKNFISFPTTIFLNKKHQVVKVHAGFTGPGTGDFFEKWKIEFEQTVTEILEEK